MKRVLFYDRVSPRVINETVTFSPRGELLDAVLPQIPIPRDVDERLRSLSGRFRDGRYRNHCSRYARIVRLVKCTE